MTVGDFLQEEPEGFISYLENKIGSAASSQKNAWENSVCGEMKKVLAYGRIKGNIGFAAEYQIPHLLERIDVVLTGKNSAGKKVILIIELKQWSRGKFDYCKEEGTFLISGLHGDYTKVHPSEQMRKYKHLILNSGLVNIEKVITDDQKDIYGEIEKHLQESKVENEKRVLIVKGGPGTGKSTMYAVKARL